MKSNRLAGILLWGALLALVAIPLVFFVAHMNDSAFISATMGNWLATIFGVMSGGAIAFVVARRQLADQAKLDAEAERGRRAERTAVLLPRLVLELRENERQAKRLEEALSKPSRTSSAFWEWAVAITKGMSAAAYRALIEDGHDRALRYSSAYIHIAYDMLQGLIRRIAEAQATIAMAGDTQSQARMETEERSFLAQLSRETVRRLEEAISHTNTERQALPKLGFDLPEAA